MTVGRFVPSVTLPDVSWIEILTAPVVVAIIAFLAFLAVGYFVGRATARIMRSLGVSDMVEGTTFERTAQGLGSSTVAVMARISSWFIYGVGALVALHVMGVLDANLFWQEVTVFVPQLFVALLILIVGIVVGEKAALILEERLRSVKLPEVTLLATLTKYSIILLAALVALGQIGVATSALLIVLAAYAFGLVFLSGLACRDLLRSAAAGVYLLLQQPYRIGDAIRVGDRQGIVQEIDLFVTYVESDGDRYVIPNAIVLKEGITHVE